MAKLVINATGVFADAVTRLDNPNAKHTMKPSQGIHIVLDKSFLPGNSAIRFPKPMTEEYFLPYLGLMKL